MVKSPLLDIAIATWSTSLFARKSSVSPLFPLFFFVRAVRFQSPGLPSRGGPGSPLKRGSVSDEDAGGRAGKRRRFRVQRLVNGATETAGTVPKLFVPPGTVIQRDSSLVGNRISVWWPQEKKSYFGDVIDWDAKDQMHEVQFSLGGGLGVWVGRDTGAGVKGGRG